MRFFLVLCLALLAGCAPAPNRARGDGTVLLVMGDSLSAGYGLSDVEKGWVSGLERQFRADGFLATTQTIANGSVSGETTGGGLRRLPDLLEENKPETVVIELGANDGMRRQSMEQMADNLKQMIALSRQAGANVVLVGVRVPTMMSMVGGGKLEETYEKVSDETKTPLLWFPWDDLLDQEGMMQEDRIHPTERAQPAIVDALEEGIRRSMGQDTP